jgi:hypothetical protein
MRLSSQFHPAQQREDRIMENSTDSKINQARDGITQIGRDLRSDAHAGIDKIAERAAGDRATGGAGSTPASTKWPTVLESTSERPPRAASNWRPAKT